MRNVGLPTKRFCLHLWGRPHTSVHANAVETAVFNRRNLAVSGHAAAALVKAVSFFDLILAGKANAAN
jgi:hypothetical protein